MTTRFEESATALGYSLVGEPIIGGSSTVYPAVHAATGDRVALKVLSLDHDRARLEREAAILSTLDHPGIARFRELCVIDGSSVLVVEWVEGERLSNIMKSVPLPLDQVVDIAAQLAAALDTVHSAGIIHRDVSPANIMVESASSPIVRIIDFGVSRTADGDVVTVEGTIAGTARYLAPETIRGEPPTPQTDQYSVAVLVYELVAGAWPFPDADAFVAAMHHHLHSEPIPVREVDPSLPPAVESGLLRALSKDPAARFSTVGEFVTSLTSEDKAVGSSTWSKPFAMSVAVLIGTVLVAIGVFALLSDSSGDEVNAELTAPSTTETVLEEPETTTSTTDGAQRFELSQWESGFAESLVCNVVTEADFEDPELPRNFYLDPENPTRDRVVEGQGVDGSGALEVGDPGAFGIYGEALPVDPDASYIFSLNSRIDGDVFDSQVWIDWLDEDFQVVSESNSLNLANRPPGQHALVTEPSPAAAAYGVPRIFKDSSSGLLFVDELVFARSDSDCAGILAQ